jgi:DNA modification methylase
VIRLGVADARRLPLVSSSVSLVVTSPPYWGLRDYGTSGEIGGEPSVAGYLSSMCEVLSELARVLTPMGSVFLVIGDKYARTGGVDRKSRGTNGDPGGRAHTRPKQRGVPGVPDGSLIGLPYRVALAAIEDGWLWRQDIVWSKPNPLPESVRRRCVRSHETVIHLTRTARHYTRPTSKGGELGHDVWPIAVSGYRDPAGVPTPAVYPLALVRRIVRDWNPPAGLVLDPFTGSGTTAVAAQQLGVDMLGFDIDQAVIAAALRRCPSARGRDASPEPSTSDARLSRVPQ